MGGCPNQCCQEQTAECLACAAGMPESDFCLEHPNIAGCPKVCCKEHKADCLACQVNIDVATFCEDSSSTPGCQAVMCPWLTPTDADFELQCIDGTRCNHGGD